MRAPAWVGPVVSMLIAVGALTCPAPARALTVSSAKLRFGARSGDSYQVSGTAQGLSLDGAEHVVFALDERSVALAVADAARKKGRLRWRLRKGTAFVTQLRLDPKTGKFMATGSKLVLAGLPNPLYVRLGTDGATDCGFLAMNALHKRGKRRADVSTWLFKAGHPLPTDCGFDGTPQLIPSVVPVGVATTVRAIARVRPGIVDQSTHVALVTVDAHGQPAEGGASCTLEDDGDPSHGDAVAGDGVYGCLTTVTESTPGHVALSVRVSRTSFSLSSPGLTLTVASPLTLEDAQNVLDGQNALRTAWQTNLAKLGDTLQARTATIAEVRGLAGVLSATIASDGLSITLEFPGGVISDLVLHPFDPSAPAPAIATPRRQTGVARPRSIVAGDACPDAASNRTPVRNAHVLVWNVLSDPGVRQSVQQTFGQSVCPRFEVELVEGPNTTVESVKRFGEFGTVIMLTHGLNDAEHGQRFLTGEGAPPDARGIYDMGKDFIAGRVSFFEYGLPASLRPNLAIRPAFFDPGLEKDNVVYAGFCHSADNIAFAEAMAPGGTYFGFTNTVFANYVTGLVPRQLYPALVDQPLEPRLTDPAYKTTGEAFDGVTPKKFVTPVAEGGGTLVINDFVLAGGTDRLAYLGRPTLEPASPTIGPLEQQTFAVTLNGSETCDLEYHWKNTADHGRLDDPLDLSRQNDFQSETKSAFYVANDPTVPGRDDLTVDFLALPPSGGDRQPVAHVCGGIVVSETTSTTTATTTTTTTIPPTCGNQMLDAGEQCDGELLSEMCSGMGLPCRSDCTCTDGCTSSSQCGIASCCRVSVGVCCPWGGAPCPGHGASPFGDSSGSCSNTPPADPPDFPQVCGPSSPAKCPMQAVSPVYFECTTCRDNGRFIAELYNTQTMQITPLQ